MRYEIGEHNCWNAFLTDEFSNWKKKDRLKIHDGDSNSAHNQTWRKCNSLMNKQKNMT